MGDYAVRVRCEVLLLTRLCLASPRTIRRCGYTIEWTPLSERVPNVSRQHNGLVLATCRAGLGFGMNPNWHGSTDAN